MGWGWLRDIDACNEELERGVEEQEMEIVAQVTPDYVSLEHRRLGRVVKWRAAVFDEGVDA